MMTETFHAGPNLGQLSDVTIIHGDCIEAMRELADDSVDAIVTDPPYGLEFMGKEWDKFDRKGPASFENLGDGERFRTTSGGGGGRTTSPVADKPRYSTMGPAAMLRFGEWSTLWCVEALRVLKPGGHLLAFGGTRTWHRLAVAVEDAGFEIRDSIAWLYGSGFPKSLDVSKAIDKAAGATREVVGYKESVGYPDGGVAVYRNRQNSDGTQVNTGGMPAITAPATPQAEQWQGWGTALKPAFEPVVVGRKPFKGNVAANVLAYGTGALNIDGCRIGTTVETWPKSRRYGGGRGDSPEASAVAFGRDSHGARTEATGDVPAGRWPANVILDESQAAALDEQSGTETSRFFYSAKAPKKERPTYERDGESTMFSGSIRKRCTICGKQEVNVGTSACSCPEPDFQPDPSMLNQVSHPTVKPLALMRWLVRLVTPPGGVVLDPFAGSGTTVEAALLEGFRVIGIEREADYLPMIQQRIARTVS